MSKKGWTILTLALVPLPLVVALLPASPRGSGGGETCGGRGGADLRQDGLVETTGT